MKLSVKNFSKSVQLARNDNDFSTEEEYAEYDFQRRLRKKTPNAKCNALECSLYLPCKGICTSNNEHVSKLKQCPLNHWSL